MNESLRRGERGVSILGALVVALMLGAGTVATFEIASPSLSSVADESQLAASHIVVTKPKAAPPKATAGGKCIDVIACDQATPVNVDTILTQPCTPGFIYEIGESGGKVTVAPQPKHSGSCKAAGFTDSEILKASDDSAPKGVAPLKEIKCDASNLKKGHIKPGEAAKCEYKYCTALKLRATRDRIGNPSKPAEQSEAGCSDGSFDPGKTFGELRSTARAEAIGQIVEGMTKDDLARIDPSELTNLDPRAQGPLNDALSGAKQGIDNIRAENADRVKAIDDTLKKCASSTGCAGVNQDVLKAERKDLVAQNRDLLAQSNKLAALQRTLADEAAKGPPSKGPPDGPPGPPSPTPGPGPGPGPGANNSTFGDQKSGGLPQELQKLLGGQPPAGNQTPKPPGTCSAGQTLCTGNTLYSRNNQCVDTPIQYCQYGCAQTSQTSGGGGSSFLSFFGIGNSTPSQCAPPPQQNQNCQPAPAQPTPSNCQNGTWKPTYTGACVTGWQCVPGSGTPTPTPGVTPAPITALLTCQPQIVDVGMTVFLTYSCSAGTSEGGGFQTGGAQTGSSTATISNPPAGTNVATFGLKCTEGGISATKQCSVQVARPAIVLVANPKQIPSGRTSAIGWVTSGMRSCVISSTNLQSFTEQHKYSTNVNGAVVTPPLTQSSDFVLKCETLGGGTRAATTTVTVQ
ncbi:hypothetical protein HY417_00765 [Candidatus Kaiserbacteria bacterium]|nr:hypothetical protein [Candidatus Kaiserbacteria bacterium]